MSVLSVLRYASGTHCSRSSSKTKITVLNKKYKTQKTLFNGLKDHDDPSKLNSGIRGQMTEAREQTISSLRLFETSGVPQVSISSSSNTTATGLIPIVRLTFLR